MVPQRPARREHVPPYCPPTAARPQPPAVPATPRATQPESRNRQKSGIPAPGPARPLGVGLVLRIEETWYSLSLLPGESGSLALRTWRLAKIGGDKAVYQVSELPYSEGRFACECGDWHFRHEGQADEGCKHIRAILGLVELGLLAPLPWALATDPEERWGDGDRFDGSAEGNPYDRTPAELAGAASEGGTR